MNRPPLPSPIVGDGYDWIEALPRSWHVVASWGSKGWDLGSWPYVVIVIYIDRGEYVVATYCEGDISEQSFTDIDSLYAAIDSIAEFHWRHGSDGPDDLPPVSGLAEHHRGPYRR